MSTEFDLLWGDLDALEKELENRIQQRQEIMGSLSRGQIDLSEAVEKARAAGIELFDEERLSIVNLRQQLNALQSLRNSEQAYRETIESMDGYYKKAQAIELRLELITRLQAHEMKHREIEELSDSTIEKTREYLEKAQRNLGDSSEDDALDNLARWLEGIEEDNKMLRYLEYNQKKGLEGVQKQLEEEELDPEQRRKLLDLLGQYPDSRLLNHFRQKDSFYRLSQQELAEAVIDPEELKQCKNQIVGLVKTLQASPKLEFAPQLEELQTAIKTKQQAYIWQQVFGDWFMLLWGWWSSQESKLNQELNSISNALSNMTTIDQFDQLIGQMRDSLNETDAVVFCRYKEQWIQVLSSVVKNYRRELSKLWQGEEDGVEKYEQAQRDLERYEQTLRNLADKKQIQAASFRGLLNWNYGMSQDSHSSDDSAE